MNIVKEVIDTAKSGAISGANLSALAVCMVILGLVPNGKNRYYYLILFIVAICAGFYLLLYLYHR